MITYQVETYHDVIHEIWPMLLAHYTEIATDKEVKPFDPDLDRYLEMESQGILRIFTARDVMHEHKFEGESGETIERGRLVGYFISVVMRGLHYQQTTMAINDIMYVDPEHRGSTGYRLIQHAIEDLKNLGADILTIHMKTDYPFRPLLQKLDFHLTEENWERVLTHETKPQRTPR